ncbi:MULTISPECIES: tRNA (adenosine(37)-N6)-threonylcarbamoyltransferase complex dimerization subunit type 1 TsaB [Clostridia]|uniref:tRNA (adenosine(37)-N6)-threonylcarbamoyltransferase complex dimerization subunit type 1 TsaB n=1 Tax=Clostridia TaxID=186801 RepID=UPI000EACE425|nr:MULTISPECIES: tRNA (adenosine(37)-N6)-threonylcarbamoyltransferase complex dimerization subunit type 1 TsaB [Clostridia]RKQ23384.1 tRNA (adenosine(37)-N6)-threonylcarbamoyltransferase complex dimerization subunit type 1 TsaB [Ruminococcus sp. B05]TAP29180.1 tRNA (adenosine(37)-N6)-threonylcarbamoyltransferase complex dimerization subunit type 1 TsaB [Mediterraneibacter sp. gm002]
MRVLAIDSSGMTATVAVVEDTQTIAEYTVNFKKTHSQTLLPMIDTMGKMIELELKSIDAIAVAGGPGSFTGLRIGSATAKGLGLALEKPLIHVPTVDGLAYNLYGCQDIICPIMDARRKQVYTGMYTFARREVEGSKETELVLDVLEAQNASPIEELIERLNIHGRPVVFLGDGVPVYQDVIKEKMRVPFSFAPASANRQRAAVVGALGIQYYKEGKFETAMEHQPDYLRVSQAERERAEKERKAVVAIRQMKVEDAAAIAEMEHQTFSDAWSEKAILDTLRNPKTICLVAEKIGKIVGYCIVYTADDEADIARIAVLKESRRFGVASELIHALDVICWENQIQIIMLDVRVSNDDARAFYEKHGFTQDGIRENYYKNPIEDAILMSRAVIPTKK